MEMSQWWVKFHTYIHYHTLGMSCYKYLQNFTLLIMMEISKICMALVRCWYLDVRRLYKQLIRESAWQNNLDFEPLDDATKHAPVDIVGDLQKPYDHTVGD